MQDMHCATLIAVKFIDWHKSYLDAIIEDTTELSQGIFPRSLYRSTLVLKSESYVHLC